MDDNELWNKYLVASLNAAKYEGALRGLLTRYKSDDDLNENREFLAKQIEDILTPDGYNVKM